jgi:beta-lactamase regulating signal transducer with metallopeptidase domain/predicted  nucleic acid-binding Zn-ribbon protein
MLAWLGASLLRRTGPRVRQILWTSVVAGVLLLPLLSSVLPAWKILPAALGASPIELRAGGQASPVTASATTFDRRVAWRGSSPTLPTVAWSWSQIAMLSWALGGVVVALAFAFGLLRLRAITLSAQPADRRILARAKEVAGRLGVRRPVRLLFSDRVASPATWGVYRPVIVVPRAAQRWNSERLDLVLAHEMVHVARLDWAWRLLARLGCAAYWFNPLSWLATRRLRFEQELACDLAVVELGTRPSTYAYHLLNIARAAGAGQALPFAGLDMARRGQMEGRLMSILTDRPAGSLRRGLLLPALCVLVALPVLAAVQPKAPEALPAPTAPEAPESSAASMPPVVPALAPPASPVASSSSAPVAPLELDAREREIAERIALKAAEIEALVGPMQEEIERQMEEELYPVLERLQGIELEMRPFHEEMSRIGEEMSRAMELQMPQMLEMEEFGRQAEVIGREMEKRAELTEHLIEAGSVDRERLSESVRELNEALEPMRDQLEALRLRMEAQRPSFEEIRLRMEPHRERMEQLRLQLEPQRERMEAIRRELEPVRERMESLREERMAEIHARMEALRAEMAELQRELGDRSGG